MPTLPPYDDGDSRRGRASGTGLGGRIGGPAAPRRGLPARLAVLAALVVVVLVATSRGSIRSWWAHRLHDVTGGSWPADFLIGLVVGLLPLLGVLAGAFLARRQRRAVPVRVLRMLAFGALGFVLTYLVSPSPVYFLVHHASTRVFGSQAPGYLAGVFTGAVVWLAALVLAGLRARSWWRGVTRAHRAGHRVIDI